MNKHALLIGCPVGTLRGVANDVSAMARVLERYGFDIDTCQGAVATRADILARMDRLIHATQAGDAAIIYYTGHGGKTPNLGRPGPGHPSGMESFLQPHHYQFLVPVDIHESRVGDFRGILDIELAQVLTRLTGRTANVTVIMDCCHAEGVMRPLWPAGVHMRTKAFDPAVLQRFDQICAHLRHGAQGDAPALHPSSNPLAVKLWATTAERSAYEREVRQGETCGVFTYALCDALNAAHGRAVSWRAVFSHIDARVRELGQKAQQPRLDGPRERLLFSLEPADEPAESVAVPWPWPPSASRADIARQAASGRGEHTLTAELAITWSTVRDGRPHPVHTLESADPRALPSPVATLPAGERVFFELHNRDPTTNTYWNVFDISPSGQVTLITRNERHGVRVQCKAAPYFLGARANDRVYGWPLGPIDAHAVQDHPPLHSFLFVVSDTPCDLGALETRAAEPPASNAQEPDLREFMERAPAPATRSLGRAGVDDAPIRYAVMRLDFRISAAPDDR